MGALRFSLEEGGPFLSCDEELSAPPWATLRDLENAAVMIDSNPNSALSYFARSNQLMNNATQFIDKRNQLEQQYPDKFIDKLST